MLRKFNLVLAVLAVVSPSLAHAANNSADKPFGLDPNSKEQRLKFDAASGVPIDSPVLVTDMIMDGNLGQPFMSQYVITFDLAQGHLWFTKANE